MGSDSPIDMSKLTERELLILLNQKVTGMSMMLDKVSDEHIKLRERVSNIETRQKVVAASWGVGTVLINVFISAFKIFR